jgi:hypothetical protein
LTVHELGAIPNVLSLDRDGRVVAGPTHVEDVRSLPTPDFTGLPLDRYLNAVPVLPIVTGKGCYFNRCKFCDIPFINHVADKPYRLRRPEQVVHDVRTLRTVAHRKEQRERGVRRRQRRAHRRKAFVAGVELV